jgi:hypothetical protein|eukprot:SAG25_NODE_538_length_7095_cov_40.279588_3_plen_75_part_00
MTQQSITTRYAKIATHQFGTDKRGFGMTLFDNLRAAAPGCYVQRLDTDGAHKGAAEEAGAHACINTAWLALTSC